MKCKEKDAEEHWVLLEQANAVVSLQSRWWNKLYEVWFICLLPKILKLTVCSLLQNCTWNTAIQSISCNAYMSWKWLSNIAHSMAVLMKGKMQSESLKFTWPVYSRLILGNKQLQALFYVLEERLLTNVCL